MRKALAWLEAHRAVASLVTMVVLVGLTFALLHRLTETIHIVDLRAALAAIASGRIVLALILTVASYLALTLYDYLALRLIGRPLPWRIAAIGSFVSYTLSHNLGLSALTGGSARYRIYSRAGLDGGDVARIVGIAGAMFWTGVLAIAGIAMACRSAPLPIGTLALGVLPTRLIGGAILLAILGLLLFCAYGPRRISLFGFPVPVPSARLAVAQIGVSAFDLAAASAALFVLIPGADPALLPAFVLAYALALVATLIAHVPGGLGVFEAVMMATVPTDKAALFAALIAYRLLYYLLPLALGIVAFALHEGKQRRLGRTIAGVRSVARGLAPLLMSTASFLGGGLLLLSGSTPAIAARLTALHGIVPLPFIEASHLAASLTGTGLILLAPGLYRRLDGAFVATRALLLAGAAFSLAKGIDYEEAIVCLAIAALLQWTRAAFYRRTTLIAQPFSASWIACVTVMCGLSFWVGLFSYRNVAYDDGLWWSFALTGDASRYLRASLGVAVILIGVAALRLFAPAGIRPGDPVDPDAVDAVLAGADRTEAMLALTGDKRFLFSPAKDAFLMYQVRGSTWIVMGDPIGPQETWPDLLWALRMTADAAQGRLVLYQISADMLDMAIELGLQLVKYGEEAIVDLADFALDGPRMRSIRHTERRAEREGARFEVVSAAGVPAILPELKAISDQWLVDKGQREKGFSLGSFDPAYIARCDCALVRVEGRIVAFANVWKTANRRELSVDLMRQRADAPAGVMDYLFANLMLWGRANGYAGFSLGLAPLSGIEARRLSPLWAKAAAMIFRHGERFYGFKGLRAYKEKFAPAWEPRYIAAPHGLRFITAMGDLNRLIGKAQPATEPARAIHTKSIRPAPEPALA